MDTLILGASGLAGSALARQMNTQGRKFVAPTSHELDLLDLSAFESFLAASKINTIYFLAAKVGGAPANLSNPHGFLMKNLQMEINVLETSIKKRIPKLIFISSSTIYPEFGQLPHTENEILSGKLSPSVKPYALAKLVGMELVQIAIEKYNLPWITAVPSNLYGINDNFRTNESHVIASIIRKLWVAKIEGRKVIEVLGEPNNSRDFLFSSDLASALLFVEKNYSGTSPINIGPGKLTSIGNLANLLSELMNYQVKINWNKKVIAPTSRKFLDNTKLRSLGFEEFTELRIGLNSVLKWLDNESLNNFKNVRW